MNEKVRATPLTSTSSSRFGYAGLWVASPFARERRSGEGSLETARFRLKSLTFILSPSHKGRGDRVVANSRLLGFCPADYAAGDAPACVAGWLSLQIVGFRVDHD